MSKCMTIADESIDQKDTCREIAPKEIVEFVLEEILLSALVISDKGCSRIGDFNITEDFCQQYDRPQYLKDFEQVNHTGNPSLTNQESSVNSGKSTDRPAGLVTAKENLELIIDSFVKKEGKSTPGGECTIITEEVLADNELQIQNGQSHIEKNNRGKGFEEAAAREYFDKKDVIKDEKIEIEYYNEGKLTKIYVPLIPSNRVEVEAPVGFEQGQEKREKSEEGAEGGMGVMNGNEETERPFQPFTTEEFRQVWENINSSVVGRWDGDLSAKREEIATLMEKLSSVQVFSDASVDPNRPRACAFGEEDVKKIIKEIEEISFTQSHANSEVFDLTCHSDGQGDADLDSRSFIRSKDNLEKATELNEPQEDLSADLDSRSFIRSKDNLEKATELNEPQEDLSADLDSRSFIRSKDNLEKATELNEPQEDLSADIHQCERTKSDNFRRRESGGFSSEKSFSDQSLKFSSEKVLAPEEQQWTLSGISLTLAGKHTSPDGSPSETAAHDGGIQHHATEKESVADSQFYNDVSSKEGGCAAQALEPTFHTDLQHQMTGNLFGASSSQFGVHDIIGSFIMAPELLNAKEPPPFWELANGNNEEPLTKNLEVPSEIDVTRASGSMKDVEEQYAQPKSPSQQSMMSFIPNPANIGGNGLKMNSFSGTESEGSGAESYLREPGPCSNWMYRKDADSFAVMGTVNDELQDGCRSEADLPGPEKILCDIGRDSNERNQPSMEGTSMIFNKAMVSERWSQKSLNDAEGSDVKDINPQCSTSDFAPSEMEDSTHSLTENNIVESTRASHSTSQTFKLHSQKMYSGVNHESDGQARQECALTESEEAFIDETESVLQIIEPQEHSEDENSSKVSFSLLCELYQGESSALPDQEPESELSLKNNCSSEFETKAKKVYSGMTTIGPLKNTDYDPKDLTIQNIDYGKMTRITSSRQLAKEIDMFGPELTPAASVKIVEEDSDNDMSLTMEDDHVEITSLVNRDIASLTKVQKVREVMSHQPKPEDDFEDEDALPRPRLDLKDVESMTDERYKVPEVRIPLLSLEIGDGNIAAEKELIENMGLVLSGLPNRVYYEEDLEEDNLEAQKNPLGSDRDIVQLVEFSGESDVDAHSSKTVTKAAHDQLSIKSVDNEDKDEGKLGQNEKSVEEVGKVPSQQDQFSISPKCSTLGSVFRKASSKFIRKDADPFLRNSKSLPRETTKISATDSLRSILDDCQSSASNVLKKSKSLLKNTQSIFKSISSSRVSSERDFGQTTEKKKLSPSESDVSTLERKLSSFLKKEESTKAKNLIKSKVEKTFKSSENSTTGDNISLENNDFRVAIRDEEKLRVDRIENFRKLLPKSPLVYKSQFVRSQMSVQNSPFDLEKAGSDLKAAHGKQDEEEGNSTVLQIQDPDDAISAHETGSQKQTPSEVKIPLQENPQWSAGTEKMHSSMSEEPEPQQLDYIVMETVQGLPTTDLESPSSEKENMRTENTEQVDGKTENDDVRKTTASNSLQACADGGNDVAPCFPELGEEKMPAKTPSERKIKSKKKKLTARFRSFWCSAFGRVKTSPKKGDCS